MPLQPYSLPGWSGRARWLLALPSGVLHGVLVALMLWVGSGAALMAPFGGEWAYFVVRLITFPSVCLYTVYGVAAMVPKYNRVVAILLAAMIGLPCLALFLFALTLPHWGLPVTLAEVDDLARNLGLPLTPVLLVSYLGITWVPSENP